MAYEALKQSSARQRLGLVTVGGVVMTPAEAAGISKPSQRARTPAVAAKPAPSAARPPENAATARAAERQRWEDVMLSDSVKGKERIAAAMLASGDESAAMILGKLANIRTDAERERAKAVERQQSAAGIWDRAIGKVFGTGGEA